MPDHAVPHPDVAGYVLGALEPDESRDFADHLRTCPECRREVAELSSLRTMLDQAMRPPTLPDGLAERTLAAVAREAAASPPAKERRRRLLPAVLAAAGAAALVLGVLVLPRSATPPAREIELVSADGGATSTVARLHREVQGIVVELDVEGLPASSPDSFYECWYVAAEEDADGPARVSAGTFAVPASGAVTVRMTTAADRSRYPRIEVTLEPDDGDPRRTGAVVLRSPQRR